MSLRHLLHIGRNWINPADIVRVEDLSCPESSAGADDMILVMAHGDKIPVRGPDAAELRRLLAEAGDEAQVTLSGRSARVPIVREDPVREVSE